MHGYHVFDTLFGMDDELRPRPQMAEGHEVSADGRDLAHPPARGPALPRRRAGARAGLRRLAWRAGRSATPSARSLAERVDEWRAADDRTLAIRLKRPFPLLLDALAKPDASVPFIMPERLAQHRRRSTQVTEMIGSGPYRFVRDEFVSGSRVVYAKFDGYVPRAASRRTPPSGGKVAHFHARRVAHPARPRDRRGRAAGGRGGLARSSRCPT